MKGLMADCEDGLLYLEKIEEFNKKFEFKFYEDLECRIQKLRIRIWECRYNVLEELARLEESETPYQDRLDALMTAYEMPARPEPCFGVE